MTVDELEAVWSSLSMPATADSISGRRAHGVPADRPAYLAVDGCGCWHLLVQVPDSTEPVTHQETRGLQISTERFQVGTNPEALYVDLACLDSSQNPTFSAVAQDLLRSLGTSAGAPRDAVIGALARWRAFWSSTSPGLSREDALGLFGELWFLRRWLRPVTAEKVSRWQATPGARHDFQWPAASVEVKTTASRSGDGPVHRIASLDQLEDPEEGCLHLFSLQVCDDALAANTLPALVEGLVDELQSDTSALILLNEKLAGYGYSPAEASPYRRPLRIVSERLYTVTEGFPRLTHEAFAHGLPDGISDLSYKLAVAACEPWLLATSPTDAKVKFLR